jgi:ABC-type lipoprotein export system ATPase subunit
MNNIILEVKNLIKSYPENDTVLEVLKSVDFSIEKGKTVAIVGESGSGKSTFMHLLGFLDKPDSGEILFYGNKVEEKKMAEFRNQHLGFVFQFHYLLNDFTAAENVAMPMFIKTKNWKKSLSEAESILQKLDILKRKNHYPNQLSGGEQQRVAIGRAMINEPDIILADEPTGNLDEKHGNEIMKLLLRLNKINNQTIIIVTHNQNIANLMNKKYEMKSGKLREI